MKGYEHRDQHRGKVCEDAQRGVREIEDGSIHTISARDAHIPRLCNRVTTEDIGQNAGHIIPHCDKDNRQNRRMKLPTGYDPSIEREYGDLGKSSRSAVEDCCKQIQLQ